MFEEATEEKGTNTEGKTSILIKSGTPETQMYRKYGSTVSFLHYVKYVSSLLQEILLCFEGQNYSAVI